MRHKWVKKKNDFIVDEDRRIKTKINKSHVCVKCGLNKGYANVHSNWYELVYYKDNEILSRGVLPFKCIGDKMKDMFITEEDFKL